MPQYRGKTPRLQISELELEEIIAFVAKTTVSYQESWLEELRNGKMDAFVAVLLCQLSQLTYLFLGSDFLRESQIVGLVLRSTICETTDCGLRPDFGNLKSVSFEKDPNYEAYKVLRNTADILPLFYLPSVTQISATIENPISPTKSPQPAKLLWPTAHQPSCPNLRSLKLTDIREPFLGQLLSVTDQVKSLNWEWYYNPTFKDQVHTAIIDLFQFTTAISQLHNTLEELIISAVCDYGGDIEYPLVTIHGSFKAIADFDKLTKFTAPLALLVGFLADETKQIQDFLPRNLEFLTITDDLSLQDQYEWEDHEVLGVIGSWLQNFQSSTRRLRRIALFLRLADDSWNQSIRNQLQELCAGVEIQLEITKLNEDMN
jgi:hypothetical protein